MAVLSVSIVSEFQPNDESATARCGSATSSRCHRTVYAQIDGNGGRYQRLGQYWKHSMGDGKMANNREEDDKRSGSSSGAARNQSQGGGSDTRSSGGSDNKSGGKSDDRSSSAENNPGNFKNDPERAAEAGRKGGEASHEGDSRGRGSDQGRGGGGSSSGDKR